MIYRLIFRLFLQRIDAERAHSLASSCLRPIAAIPFSRAILQRLLRATDERLQVRALGMTFPTPLGVAAGVDKDATWFDSLGALGFGFVEVGTITALPQTGSPRPRIFRVPRDRAVLNRMGFPNPGATGAAQRLQRRSGRTIVGVNIGKSKAAPMKAVGDDYRAAIRELAPHADYVVVNVSSPNTPGLREMQAVALLRPLIGAVRLELHEAGVRVPILIKIGPDLSDAELDAVGDLAVDLELDGIVAVNTTVSRDGLTLGQSGAPFDDGGVSGAPLKARALEVLQRLRNRVGSRLVLISVGGIETADDAWERILAGATLIQGHTGFVYGGPAWAGRLNRGLAHRVTEVGADSIADVVGTGTTGPAEGSAPAPSTAMRPSNALA